MRNKDYIKKISDENDDLTKKIDYYKRATTKAREERDYYKQKYEYYKAETDYYKNNYDRINVKTKYLENENKQLLLLLNEKTSNFAKGNHL